MKDSAERRLLLLLASVFLGWALGTLLRHDQELRRLRDREQARAREQLRRFQEENRS